MPDREVIVFNKDGSKFGKMQLQQLYYLETEREWIQKRLDRSTQLDGLAFIIDWSKKEIIPIRYANN
jgi:hypothetical protein